VGYRWSAIHFQELGVHAAAANAQAPAVTVLNAADGRDATGREISAAAAIAAGLASAPVSWSVEEAVAGWGPAAYAFALNQRISGARARALLGWEPRRPALLDDLARGSYSTLTRT
jgi:nucleoside-diphosphate-sugar epimerase